MELQHTPVLLDEAICALNIKANGTYLDVTYGRGGHSRAIIERLSSEGRLYIMDRDPEAIDHANRHFFNDPRVQINKSAFSDFPSHIKDNVRFDGVLADLGLSSPQLDNPERGFGFHRPGPLDMRMDTEQGENACQWLARAKQSDIRRVLYEFGEEQQAGRIAKAIVQRRQTKSLETTSELADLVSATVPGPERGKHPATKTFQAIRIYLNAELDQLGRFLEQIIRYLETAGRLVIISFHSLEDRIVKRFIREQSRGDGFPVDLPITADQLQPRLKTLGKPIRPNPREVDANRRARSAVMRIAERTEF